MMPDPFPIPPDATDEQFWDWHERSAIKEYCGGMDHDRAELQAAQEVWPDREWAGPGEAEETQGDPFA